MAFSNMELFKNVVDNTKKQSKHITEIGKEMYQHMKESKETATMIILNSKESLV